MLSKESLIIIYLKAMHFKDGGFAMRWFLICFIVFYSSLIHARLIQIIHTNDLHSYFPGYENGNGGYARLMTKIKELRANAKERGVEVLQLDAGDWGDGTSFFLSDNGADSLRALEMLGTEVTTIGNHDHMLGGKVLGEQIRRSGVKTKFVASNITTTPEMELEGVLLPHLDLERAGIKIRIIGLTTSSDYFEYSMRPGDIHYSVPVGEKEAKKAKEEGRELVIALTHIGQYEDRALAQGSGSIDLIVGGHSHTKLSDIDWETNKNGKRIPIVQAWAHGLAVGSLLLDVSDTGEVKVVEYKLHEVGTPLQPDPEMVSFIEASAKKRNRLFDVPWDQVIGETHTHIRGYKNGMPNWGSSCWGWHMARATRKAVDADVGLHIAAFEGVAKEPGPVTFGDIIDNYPHVRKYGEQGWEIATVYMSGWKLRPFMFYLTRRGYGVNFSGAGYKLVEGTDDIDIADDAVYKVAFPAEVAHAIQGSLTQYRKYLDGLKFTGVHYWPSVMNYVKENSPISCN